MQNGYNSDLGGSQRGKFLICGHSSIKSLRTPGLHYFDVNFLLFEKVLCDHIKFIILKH
jgi:hypothetical protein